MDFWLSKDTIALVWRWNGELENGRERESKGTTYPLQRIAPAIRLELFRIAIHSVPYGVGFTILFVDVTLARRPNNPTI